MGAQQAYFAKSVTRQGTFLRQVLYWLKLGRGLWGRNKLRGDKEVNCFAISNGTNFGRLCRAFRCVYVKVGAVMLLHRSCFIFSSYRGIRTSLACLVEIRSGHYHRASARVCWAVAEATADFSQFLLYFITLFPLGRVQLLIDTSALGKMF